MSLHAPLNSHQHPTACSPSVLITSCLPLFHPLINSTPTISTLGVVSPHGSFAQALWRIVSGKAPYSQYTRKGEEDKFEEYQVKAVVTKLLALCG